MRLELVSWNFIDFNDGNPFRAWIPPGQLTNLSANGVSVPRSDDFPFLSTAVLSDHVFTFHVQVDEGESINASRELLKQIFNITDKGRHELIAKDLDDSNRWYQLVGLPIRITEQSPGAFTIQLHVETPIWEAVNLESTPWSVTFNGDTQVIDNISNVNVAPILQINVASKISGLQYRRWVAVYNVLDTSFNAPIDIGKSLFDTQTLISGGKMQVSGNDLRVFIDGVEVNRWLQSIDTIGTQVWVNMSLSPKQEGTISTTVNSGDGPFFMTLTFANTKANRDFLIAMSKVSNKLIMIENEVFTFMSVNLFDMTMTGVDRAKRGTSAATHTAPVTVRWIEHDIFVLYGDNTLSAPDTDDRFKPLFQLSSSNLSWIYSTLYDKTANRPGAWKPEVNASRGGLSYYYTDTHTAFVNPGIKLGLALIGYVSQHIPQAETGQLDWLFFHPAGVTDVQYSGQKYMFSAAWPAVMGLQVLEENVGWFTVETEDAPITPITWEPFGPVNADLGGTYQSIRFAIDGSLAPLTGDSAMIEFDAITLTFDSTRIPEITMFGEVGIAYLTLKIENLWDGNAIYIEHPADVGDTLFIDCRAKRAYLNDDKSDVRVRLSSSRNAWLDLVPGNDNELEWIDPGTGTVSVTVSYYPRQM